VSRMRGSCDAASRSILEVVRQRASGLGLGWCLWRRGVQVHQACCFGLRHFSSVVIVARPVVGLAPFGST
jgi:hypothetical protein